VPPSGRPTSSPKLGTADGFQDRLWSPGVDYDLLSQGSVNKPKDAADDGITFNKPPNATARDTIVRNVFDIDRKHLLKEIERLRIHIYKKPRITEEDTSKHFMPISQMGNYHEVLMKQERLRTIDGDEGEKKPYFGNPFVKHKGTKMTFVSVDEADDLQAGTSIGRKRPGSPLPQTRRLKRTNLSLAKQHQGGLKQPPIAPPLIKKVKTQSLLKIAKSNSINVIDPAVPTLSATPVAAPDITKVTPTATDISSLTKAVPVPPLSSPKKTPLQTNPSVLSIQKPTDPTELRAMTQRHHAHNYSIKQRVLSILRKPGKKIGRITFGGRTARNTSG